MWSDNKVLVGIDRLHVYATLVVQLEKEAPCDTR